jgi:hypothetical protein
MTRQDLDLIMEQALALFAPHGTKNPPHQGWAELPEGNGLICTCGETIVNDEWIEARLVGTTDGERMAVVTAIQYAACLATLDDD